MSSLGFPQLGERTVLVKDFNGIEHECDKLSSIEKDAIESIAQKHDTQMDTIPEEKRNLLNIALVDLRDVTKKELLKVIKPKIAEAIREDIFRLDIEDLFLLATHLTYGTKNEPELPDNQDTEETPGKKKK